MKKLLFLIMALFSLSINAQNTSIGRKFTDENFYKVFKIAAYKAGAGLIEAKNIPFFLIDSISSTSHKELIPYKGFIKKCFEKMYSTNFSKSSYIPELIKYKGSDCVIFKNIVSGNIYNNNKLNDKERAVIVFNDIASKALSSIGSCSNNPPQYIGVSILYSSKDFAKDKILADDESLVLIVSFKTVKDFHDLEISEDALIEKSDIMLYKLGGTLRKVELHL